ncbi:hypothetical protein [Mycobacterium malmoense]|uniref:hypothetical protein n=1 Tax=Mycobacterium malmoense TaxID=1780 RepID=UPI00159474B7|nr:hypothetical protein [Mycobacterium malmoense]
MFQRGVQRLIEVAPDALAELRFAGNQLCDTLSVLGAAARWDRHRLGFTGLPWTMVGIFTLGRLLAPPGWLRHVPRERRPRGSRCGGPPRCSVNLGPQAVRRHRLRRIMPSSQQRPRHLAEHRVTLLANGQISVIIFSDGIIVIESAAQQWGNLMPCRQPR